MAWLVWNGVVVDGFEGGRLSVPSSLLRFYPARCAGIPPCCCCCVCSPCGRGRAGRPCPAKSPPIKVVCLTSPPSPREKESTAQATPKRRWLKQVSYRFCSRGPPKLPKQSNNRKTVAHIINPGKITRFVHAIDLA